MYMRIIFSLSAFYDVEQANTATKDLGPMLGLIHSWLPKMF